MQKILVFTDIHIVPEGDSIIGLDPSERFQMGLDHALAQHPDAVQIMITGDLTHHGDPVEYIRLREMLTDCPLPVNLMVGNHDTRQGFRAAFPDTPVTDDGYIQSWLDVGAYRLILLDTADEDADIPHSGLLCSNRLAWLDQALKDAKDRPVILFMHHPPILTGFDGMDRIGLRNRPELAHLLRRHNNVCQIIAGHVHRTISGAIAGIPTAIFKSPCHQMPMALADADSHLSINEPGAYGILLLGDDNVIVHTEDFTLPQHAPETYHTKPKDAA